MNGNSQSDNSTSETSRLQAWDGTSSRAARMLAWRGASRGTLTNTRLLSRSEAVQAVGDGFSHLFSALTALLSTTYHVGHSIHSFTRTTTTNCGGQFFERGSAWRGRTLNPSSMRTLSRGETGECVATGACTLRVSSPALRKARAGRTEHTRAGFLKAISRIQ
jgi:hypothetical protein